MASQQKACMPYLLAFLGFLCQNLQSKLKSGFCLVMHAYSIVRNKKIRPENSEQIQEKSKNGRAPRAKRAAHAHFWNFPGIFWNFPAGFFFPYNTVVGVGKSKLCKNTSCARSARSGARRRRKRRCARVTQS